MRPRSSLVFAVAVITAAVALPERRAPSQTPATENTGARPNVVVIVTDDQRADTLDVMPKTRAFLGDGGITFPQSFVATPLCCPSRASIMTGRYAHNHGVRNNRLTPELDHTTTMQAALKTAGYQTAISGKFLLYWDLSEPPPNFDHAPVPEWQPSPAVHEEDRSDKPSFVSVHRHGEAQGREERDAQLRTLYSVDDLVAGVAAKLAALGEDNDTLVILTSDNGYFWGEHGQKSKGLPYTEGIQVPLLLRFPGRAAPGTVDTRWASVADVAPTVIQAAGAAPVGIMDGTSLLAPSTRTEHYVEYSRDPGFRYPPWASLRDQSSQYIEYYEDDGSIAFREYYDLQADPYEMDNLLADADPANDPDVTVRSARLAQLATCAGRAENGAPNPCP